MAPLKTLNTPPSTTTPYRIPALCGEVIYIPCSLSATRLLVTGKETNDAFAVVGSGGTHSGPIGFHFHRETHDVFLCLKGNVNVWGGEKCRTMGPGDFASVPPNTIHQYQIIGPYSEFLGLIVPGGWEEFFRVIGDPYTDGPLFPLSDPRNPFEVLIPRLKKAAQEFDMVPLPQHKSFDPQPWAEDDNVLPPGLEPYFLKAGSGPKVIAGGTLCRPLITGTQSGGKFSIASVEGSNAYADSLLAGGKSIKFSAVHHCFQVSDGTLAFDVEGSKAELQVGETLFVPAETAFSYKFASRYAKAYVFANGGGLVELLERLGKDYPGPTIPEKAERWDAGEVEGLGGQLGFGIV